MGISTFGAGAQPVGPGRVPGGSSGGSAAAVAGGLAPCAIGTDTGGLDPPAGGALRDRGAEADIRSDLALRDDRLRLFAGSVRTTDRDVTDAALLLSVSAGSRSVRLDLGWDRGRGRGAQPGGVERAALCGSGGVRATGLSAGVLEVFEATLATIGRLGGEVAEASLPHAEHGISAYYVIAPAEASSNLARYDGVRYGMRAQGANDLAR